MAVRSVSELQEGQKENGPGIRDYRPGLFALRDTWLPLVHARRVRRKVVRRAMHGEPVLLWRDGGQLKATSSTPGEIERGNRRVSEFTDARGAYPLVERYGFAWVWYGNPETASLDLVPNIPHLPLSGLAVHMQEDVIFDATYELVCENLLDLTHADFLHSSLTGDCLADDDEVTASSTSETVTVTRIARGRQVPKMQRPFVRGEGQTFTYVSVTHVRSGLNIIHAHWDPFGSLRMVHAANPELVTRTRSPLSFNMQPSASAERERSPRLVRHLFPFVGHMVARQDNFAMLPQNTRYVVPEKDGKDLSSRFDRADLRYRKVYQDLVARQRQGDTSYLPDGLPSRDISPELLL